jgi:glutathione synthase/RimK-type ligase-like ATP-grasp enzyme
VILVWGEFDDPPFATVVTELRRLGRRLLVVTDEILGQAEFRPALAELSAGYLRPGGSPPASVRAARSVEALHTWAETAPARIVNRPSDMAANNSKPYQAQFIRAAGFATPETLITTDPSAIRAFQRRHGKVVYKSISGVRSIVSRLGPDHEAYLDDVAHCPTMFQRYVEGVDYRVHVVADSLFACRVRSSATDYRYPKTRYERPALEPTELDPDLGARITSMVRSMNLLVAGVDLRRTPDGEWYCFEVNPSPAFTYFSQATGQRIDAAIATLLATAPLPEPVTRAGRRSGCRSGRCSSPGCRSRRAARG